MRKHERMVLWVAMGLLSAVALHAQRFCERSIILRPPAGADSSAAGLRLIPALYGMAAFSGFVYDSDNEHAWQHNLGVYVELLRTPGRVSLGFSTNIEFIANPHNDINFNPRAVLWEEGLLLSLRARHADWHLGYYHRCKHDVDNLDIGEQRGLIYGSFMLARQQALHIFTADEADALLELRGDIFTLLADDRSPGRLQTAGRDYENLLAAFGIKLHVQHPLTQQLGLYCNARLSASVFARGNGFFARFGKPEDLCFNTACETGFRIRGAADFRLGIAFEYLADSEISAAAVPARLLRIGISVLAPEAMY